MDRSLNYSGPTLALLGCLITSQLFLSASYAQVVALAENHPVPLLDLKSSPGMTNWTIDGVNNLAQQWFWYRVGPAASEDTTTPVKNDKAVNPALIAKPLPFHFYQYTDTERMDFLWFAHERLKFFPSESGPS